MTMMVMAVMMMAVMSAMVMTAMMTTMTAAVRYTGTTAASALRGRRVRNDR
jgi:hypothetical protein